MDDALGVQVLEPLQSLATDRRDLAFSHDIVRDDIGQAATLHELHDDPQFAFPQVAVDEVDNVRVRAVLHHQDLVDDQVLLRLLLQVHLLNRNQPVVAALEARVDTTRRALANLVEAAVHAVRVAV